MRPVSMPYNLHQLSETCFIPRNEKFLLIPYRETQPEDLKDWMADVSALSGCTKGGTSGAYKQAD